MAVELPSDAKVTRDAKMLMQEMVSEFICVVSAEARDISLEKRHKAMMDEDVLGALSQLGIDCYRPRDAQRHVDDDGASHPAPSSATERSTLSPALPRAPTHHVAGIPPPHAQTSTLVDPVGMTRNNATPEEASAPRSVSVPFAHGLAQVEDAMGNAEMVAGSPSKAPRTSLTRSHLPQGTSAATNRMPNNTGTIDAATSFFGAPAAAAMAVPLEPMTAPAMAVAAAPAVAHASPFTPAFLTPGQRPAEGLSVPVQGVIQHHAGLPTPMQVPGSLAQSVVASHALDNHGLPDVSLCYDADAETMEQAQDAVLDELQGYQGRSGAVWNPPWSPN